MNTAKAILVSIAGGLSITNVLLLVFSLFIEGPPVWSFLAISWHLVAVLLWLMWVISVWEEINKPAKEGDAPCPTVTATEPKECREGG